jgi:hypothetical protein
LALQGSGIAEMGGPNSEIELMRLSSAAKRGSSVRKRYIGPRWFCQDGRIPREQLAKFAIDSLRESALQWAISSQSEKEQLLTTKDTKEHQEKNVTADDTDNTDFH